MGKENSGQRSEFALEVLAGGAAVVHSWTSGVLESVTCM